MKWISYISIMILIILIGCEQNDQIGVSTEKPREIAENQFIETSSGLKYSEIKTGSGASAKAGDFVTVHYTGWLTDGNRFDSSILRQKSFSFVLGQGQVIAGWDEGVAGMQIGGIRQLVIPPHLGYGERGAGSAIPPGATLIFEVQLLEVSDR